MERIEDGREEPPAHIAIQMEVMNPFVPAAEVQTPAITKLHRITPQAPVGVMDGRQLWAYSVHSPQYHSTAESVRSRIREPTADEITDLLEAQRRWIGGRETRREEDRRSPWSTTTKYCCCFTIAAVVIAVIAFLIWYFFGPDPPVTNVTFTGLHPRYQ